MPSGIKKYKFSVSKDDEGKRLDLFLHEKLSQYSRTKIIEFIKEGKAKVNGIIIKKQATKLRRADMVELEVEENKEHHLLAQKINLEIIYEDPDIIVVNKPPGILTHPTPKQKENTLVNGLLYYFPEIGEMDGIKPGIVHRLDRNTSGVLVVAKNYFAKMKLSWEFKKRMVVKKYLAVLKGNLEYEEGKIEGPIGRSKIFRKKMGIDYGRGREALTYYKLISSLPHYSFVVLYPKTGRTHQLRIHMRYIGHPIIGDRIYGVKSELIQRPALHSYLLEIIHPSKNIRMEFKAEPPQDFKNLLAKIGFKKDYSNLNWEVQDDQENI